MQLTRGTTPTITLNIKDEIDLSQVTEVWIYFSQQNKVKIDKTIEDVTIDTANNTITVLLSQDDTLGLKSGDAIFQMRMLLQDETALASKDSKVTVNEVYKGGVITAEE